MHLLILITQTKYIYQEYMKSHFFLSFFFISILCLEGHEIPSQETLSPSPKRMKPSKEKLLPAYNAPDRIAVRSSWSLDAQLSFLYWLPTEDNLEPSVLLNTHSSTEIKGDVTLFAFSYKPAFQLGIGYKTEEDNWRWMATYTRLRSTMHNSPNVPAGEHLSPILLMPQITGTNNYDELNQKWNLTLDFLDLMLSRAYYSGKELKCTYFFGLRGAWISQVMHNQFISLGNIVRGVSTPAANVVSSQQSNSWAVGPSTGIEGRWDITKKGRFFGSCTFDLLFTHYLLKRVDSSSLLNLSYQIQEQNINTLRAHIDLELGLGWGSHFADNKWYIDLSAAYGFQIFFNQNMFRTYYNSSNYVGEASYGNLYIQGLTITSRLDF
jgi:hypothetical protein